MQHQLNQELRQVVIEFQQLPRRQILFQNLTHEVHLEQGRENLVVEFSSQGEAFISAFANQFASDPQNGNVLLANLLRR